METIEVEAISPHQYRQKDRGIGERYQAEAIHLPLLEILKWVKPVEARAQIEAAKIKDRHHKARSK